MKKQIYFLVSLFALIGFSMNVMAIGEFSTPQKTSINSTRIYTVNATPGVHAGNTYSWVVYSNVSNTDFNEDSWTGVATTASDLTLTQGTGAADNSATILWKKGGNYVVQVTETGQGTGCTTIRRYGVFVLELDLLVKTYDHGGTSAALTNDLVRCNTNSGGIWTKDDADDLNAATGVTPALGSMVFTYKVSLYTAKGSTSDADLIGASLPTAKWRFTPVVSTSTKPGTPVGEIVWNVSGAASGTVGAPILVNNGVSEVTITATIKNVAADEAEKYVLNLSIDESTVNVEDGGSVNNDYAEGTELGGTLSNAGKQITVNPIPNTSTISSN